MIREIIDYYDKRNLHIGSKEEMLLFIYTELYESRSELNSDHVDSFSEEMGDVLMMTYMYWYLHNGIQPIEYHGVYIPGYKYTLWERAFDLVHQIAESHMRQKPEFTRNNKRQFRPAVEIAGELIEILEKWQDGAIVAALRRKLARKIAEIKNPGGI